MDRKQVQTGLAVTGDGGVPVFHRAFDGKAGEVNQVIGAMEALKATDFGLEVVTDPR